jgi:hypothetical protein
MSAEVSFPALSLSAKNEWRTTATVPAIANGSEKVILIDL